MKLNKLALAILRYDYLMTSEAIDSLLPVVERFLKGETISWFGNNEGEQEPPQSYLVAADNSRTAIASVSGDPLNTSNDFYANAAPGSIALIPISGTIMKADYCGSLGTDSVQALLMAALESPNIIGAVLHMDTPGGTTQNTKETHDVVEQVDSLMPVEVYCDGQLCSAGMWIAAGAGRITASSGMVQIGCIGTAANYRDYSKMSQVVTHYVTADASFDKNKDSAEVLKGNYSLLKNSIINPSNNYFLADIKADRADTLQLEDVKNDAGEVIGQYPLTGQVYLAQAAIDNGLIDAIGNLQSVLDSVRTRAAAGAQPCPLNSNKNNMSLFGTKFKKLNALSGKKAADITDEEIKEVNAEFKAEGIDNVVVITSAHVLEADGFADAISTGLQTINTSLKLTGDAAHKDLGAAITALTAAYKKEYERAEEYGDQPGEKPTKPAAAGDAEQPQAEGDAQMPAADKKKKFETSYDRDLQKKIAADRDNPFKI